MRIAPEIQSWGEGPTSRESTYRDSCTFEALAKQKKKSLTTVAISTDQCTERADSVQGVRKPLILTEHAYSSRNSIMGGGSNIEGEYLS